MIKAICHCGNIELTFESLKSTLTKCNCSICQRYAAKWMYFKSNEVKINSLERTNHYIWGDKEIAFHHCNSCGCITHYSSVNQAKFDRIAINVNLLEQEKLTNVKIRYFNGVEM